MKLYTDVFETNFNHKISQLIFSAGIHPSLHLAATSTHSLVDKDVIPYKVKYTKKGRNKETVVIAGALRLKFDPWDMARNPETQELEYIIAWHEEPLLPLTCPNCRRKAKGLVNNTLTIWKTYTTEHHAILYCPFCERFSWKKPITDLHF